jgi:heptosyltransferase III
MNNNTISVAIIPPVHLGDGLIWLVLAHNLVRNGYKVTLYSDYICHLQNWLPNIKVEPISASPDLLTRLNNFDVVLAHNHLLKYFSIGGPQLIPQHYIFIAQGRTSKSIFAKASDLSISDFGEGIPMAQRMVRFCQEAMELKNVENNCNLVAPAQLNHRKFGKRIIIHPTSSSIEKNWSAKKFLQLAKLLQQSSWEPVFCVAPSEFSEWEQKISNNFCLKHFPNLSDLAAFIYESGFMLGNDSGIGHLASALGIPTLTIFCKKRKYYRWRPGWSFGLIVSPKINWPFFKKYWKCCITVNQVYRKFEQLVEQYTGKNKL